MRRILVVLVALLGMAGMPAATPTASAAGGYTAWMNQGTTLCFGPTGGKTTAGTKVIQWPCNFANSDQWWTWLPDSASDNGYYLMRNKKAPGMCLAVPGSSGLSGTELIIWPCNPANPDQLWNASPIDGDECVIINKWSQLALTSGAYDGTWGVPLIQWYPNGHEEQKWF